MGIVIPPNELTLLECSLEESDANDGVAWSAGTTYASGQQVRHKHRVYVSLVDGNRGNDPETSTSGTTATWMPVGATRPWRMLDEYVETQTVGDEGKPLTVTNPAMTRFMMTLEDAVDLVLYAFEHGEQGDLFVQKAPAATIETLAQAVLELKGSDLGVTVIGTRHGEKLFEVLVTAEEMLRAENLPGFFRIPADNRDLNYDNYFSKGSTELGEIEQYTSHNTQRLDVEEMKALLLKLKLFGGVC